MFCRVNYWIIEENIVYDIGTNTKTGIECVGILVYSALPAEQSGDDNIIRKNIIFNVLSAGNEGSAMEADRWCNRNQFYDNVAYDNDGPGITIYDAVDNKVFNNTFYNNSLNSSGELQQKAEIRIVSSSINLTSNTLIKNNIAYAKRVNTYAIYVDTNSITGNLNIDSNCLYKEAGAWWVWGNEAGSDSDMWNKKRLMGKDLNVDPKFMNPSSYNFLLQATSPCLGSGIKSIIKPTIPKYFQMLENTD
jgi:parallel beta-helix repeat protein